MINSLEINKPLKSYFSIPQHLYCMDIACIKAVAQEEEQEPDLMGLINALYIQGYLDLERLLNCTWKEICQVPRIGIKKQRLLLSLLERISADPKTIENHKIAPTATIDNKTNIGEIKSEKIIKKYKDTRLQEATEKEARIKKIKDRLREMGMIH
ncbi:hypothetical protein NSQ91_14270 [Paenibacillus sp. FSL R7-0048]|uniref:hypothetical protein n=1 Tax=Paenibacillus TaxID=44249 RepID=UPI00096FDF27|nr:hypothetical protein [Paenibacillus odorifer]OMD87847.1 hypothetical protein BSK53_02340 [Paenibacillus odorifer]